MLLLSSIQTAVTAWLFYVTSVSFNKSNTASDVLVSSPVMLAISGNIAIQLLDLSQFKHLVAVFYCLITSASFNGSETT